jgi:hypothetical protein
VGASDFVSPDFAVPAFSIAVRLAVEAGLDAAAILDAKGKPLAVAGALDDDEARAIAAHATRQARTTDLLERMLRGELIEASLSEREARIGIAAGYVFFVVVFPRNPAAMSLVAVDELRADIEEMVHDAKSGVAKSQEPPPTSSGGSSSGPAELPVVEVGVTVRRRDSN